MSSDADYAAFLSRAQKDYSKGPDGQAVSEPSETLTTPTVSAANEVHPALKALGQRYYVSEADEEFVNVSFEWGKSIPPNEEEFSELVKGTDAFGIQVLEPDRWDPSGEYGDVVEAVRTACGGGPVVYRVERTGSRVEYFVVGVDRGNGKLVGVKVLSIES
ncbi:hypothetical protein RUND412_009065 [Rhizina undulata]